MKKRIALILAASMAASAVLAGCSGSKSGQGTSTDKATDSKPKDKQELTFNLGDEPPNLDSAKSTDSISFDILGNTMEGLIRTGEGFKILPGIAETWKVSDDGLTYTFTLRKDAKWSDGKPVTSKDFKFAWIRALDPKTASEYNYQLFYIKGGEKFATIDPKATDFQAQHDKLVKDVAIDATDDYVLKVTLETPTPYFLGLMSFPTYLPQREDVVKQYGEKYAADADKLVYNGPFTIKEWVHEDHVTLAKNPNYFDAAKVKLETVNFKMIKDANTAIQMYEAGELDRVGLPGEFIAKYSSDPGFRSMSAVQTNYITFNLENKIFQNLNIRKAFNLAIDRKGFADSVLKNGSVPAAGFVPPSLAAGDLGKTFREVSGNLIAPNGNKEEAKKYWEAGLKELGVTKLNVKLLSADSSTTKRYVQGVMEMLQSTLPGLTIENEAVASKIRLQRSRQGQFEMVWSGWIGDFNDPMTFMNMFVTGGPYNDARWSNKDFDALIKTAEKSNDHKVRMDAMAKAEKLFIDQLPVMPLYNPTGNWVSRPYVKGVLDFPLGNSLDLKGAFVEGKAK